MFGKKDSAIKMNRSMPTIDDHRVGLAPCADYEPDRVLRAVESALKPFGGIRGIVEPGARVLVKINLLNDTPPHQAAVTHPAVTRALVHLIKKAGALPIVGEQSGPAEKGITTRAFQISGTLDACRQEGVETVPFHRKGFAEVRCPENRHLKTLHIAREALEADLVFGVAKLKTHIQALYTGAVKNYFGCLPIRHRIMAHKLGRFQSFCESLVDIFEAVRPSFTLIDGIVGMEGRGPNSGLPKKLGVILAARDHMACDAVAMHLIGLNPEGYPMLEEAQRRSIGEPRLENVPVEGGRLMDYRTPFEPPPRFLLNPPRLVTRALYWRHMQKPRVDPERCEACGICGMSCPEDAISFNPKALINEKACIECLCCMELCPHDAVYEKAPPGAQALRKTKNFIMTRAKRRQANHP